MPVCALSVEQPGAGGGAWCHLRHQSLTTGGRSLMHLLTKNMIARLGHLKAVCKQITCKVPHSKRAGSNSAAPFKSSAFPFVLLSLLCATRCSSKQTRMELGGLAKSGSMKFAENGRNRDVSKRARGGSICSALWKGNLAGESPGDGFQMVWKGSQVKRDVGLQHPCSTQRGENRGGKQPQTKRTQRGVDLGSGLSPDPGRVTCAGRAGWGPPVPTVLQGPGRAQRLQSSRGHVQHCWSPVPAHMVCAE